LVAQKRRAFVIGIINQFSLQAGKCAQHCEHSKRRRLVDYFPA
jgi:hypothetical protein